MGRQGYYTACVAAGNGNFRKISAHHGSGAGYGVGMVKSKPAPKERVDAKFYPAELARIRAFAQGLPLGRIVALLALEMLDRKKGIGE